MTYSIIANDATAWKVVVKMVLKNGARLTVVGVHSTRAEAEQAAGIATAAFRSAGPEEWFHIDEGLTDDYWFDSAHLFAFGVGVYPFRERIAE